MAQAEAEAIQRIAASLPEGQAAMYLLGLKYLEALPQITQGKGTTIFLPAEAAGVMGALGRHLRELLARAEWRSAAAIPASAAARAGQHPSGCGAHLRRRPSPRSLSLAKITRERAERIARAHACEQLRRVQLQEARRQAGARKPPGGARTKPGTP